ncbi:MAG: DNA-binding protein [Anaerolineae bacterium]|nr:DNA-binding protein [Anaerolineae bacterium]
MSHARPTNEAIAGLLERIGDLLEAQGANPFRVRAYRDGAQSVRDADRSVAEWVRAAGREAIQALPGIGQGLSRLIDQYVRTGRSGMLGRLEGEVSPEDLFVQVPGIGETLARRVVNRLEIDTLEDLERAAHDGRLQEVEGFGPRRVKGVRLALSGMLGVRGRRPRPEERPTVATLLEVDAQYRERAEEGELAKIAPRRFNPEREAWLPILHVERDGWDLTALYSNTARAHELGTTHKWVVIYYDRDGSEGQATVVTHRGGPLNGKRVVRGREAACLRYYGMS